MARWNTCRNPGQATGHPLSLITHLKSKDKSWHVFGELWQSYKRRTSDLLCGNTATPYEGIWHHTTVPCHWDTLRSGMTFCRASLNVEFARTPPSLLHSTSCFSCTVTEAHSPFTLLLRKPLYCLCPPPFMVPLTGSLPKRPRGHSGSKI